jgi:hypothetical protein
LQYTDAEDMNYSSGQYPEYWGPKDPIDYLFRLVAKKNENDSLRLYIQYKVSVGGDWTEYPVPARFVNGKIYYRMEGQGVYSFDIKQNIMKFVTFRVNAVQNDEKTIEVINWKNRINDYLTWMQYPEYKLSI